MNKHLDHELPGYALEQLEKKKRAEVERHLDSCIACSAQLSEVRQMVHAMLLDSENTPRFRAAW
jgi:anti-sigma factor RsiW